MNVEELSLQELLALDRHLTRAMMQMDEVEQVFNGTPDLTDEILAPNEKIDDLLAEVEEECKRREVPEEELEPYIPPMEYTEI